MIPKFRAFVKSGTKQMYGGVYVEDAMVPVGVLDITGEEVTVWGCGRENCGMCDDYFRMKDIILMQTTGLEDKNGVEIYEGDILYHPLQGKRKVYYPYSDSVASYGLREINTGLGSTLQDAHAVWEVIGNVHENPELLEVTND